MKSILSFIVLIFTNIAFAQCPPLYEIILSSQQDVDNFINNYPNCTELNEGLTINGNITNLNGLSHITYIKGSLLIGSDYSGSSNKMTSLEGLENLKKIGGRLLISANKELLSLKGLESLESIGEDAIKLNRKGISIKRNDKLKNIEGLKSLITIKGAIGIGGERLQSLKGPFQNISMIEDHLSIDNAPSLINLEGLETIKIIKGSLLFGRCEKIINFSELESLEEIHKSLALSENNLLENFQGLENLKFINGNFSLDRNPALKNFVGLSSLKSIGSNPDSIPLGFFYVRENNNLTSFLGLDNLKSIGGNLEIRDSKSFSNFQGLESLETIGKNFLLENNEGILNLEGLSSLKTIKGIFQIRNNLGLQSLSGLSALETVNKSIYINYNEDLIEIAGFNNLNNVEGLLVIEENRKLERIEGFQKLKRVGGLTIESNNLIESLDGFNSLEIITRSLRIRDNLKLNDITALSNFYIIDPDKPILYITSNPELSVCDIPSICNFINTDRSKFNLQIHSNAEDCEQAAIFYSCGKQYNNINGLVKYNNNNDDCATSNTMVPLIKVESVNNGISYSTFTNTNGEYSLSVKKGNNTVSVKPNENLFYSNPLSSNLVFSDFDETGTANFCISSTNNLINDLEISLIPLSEPRPGFEVAYYIVYKNLGNEIVDGNVELTFDSSKLSFENSEPSNDALANNMIRWEFTNLSPFETRIITTDFKIFAPPIVNIDEELTLEAKISSNVEEKLLNNNTFTLKEITIGSYDPNDKTVLEGDQILIEQVQEFLHYVIRFQNTGTASAINVRVTDQLDENLDWDTFTPTSFSHDAKVFIENGRNVEFMFKNINLPDSTTNEKESNGFIAYKIKPKKGIQVGDIMKGKAEIYFDFNPPIITNTVSTTVSDVLSTDEFIKENEVTLFPNPVNNILHIQHALDKNITEIRVYNSLGKEIHYLAGERIEVVDLSNISNGIYFCKIKYAEKSASIHKIIKRD